MDTSPAGLAALALLVLWLGYWVPQQLRRRQVLADAGLDDRFSEGLRVLTVADKSSTTAGKGRAMRATSTTSAATGSVPLVAGSTGVPTSDTGRERTARLEVLERRAARARRRLTLTVLLVLLTAGAWTVVGLGYVHWAVAAVPSALLLAVLVMGRLAVVAARRSDARWRAERRAQRQRATQERTLAHGGPYAPRNRARITGRAVHPSSTHTQMIPRVQPAGTAAPAAGREPAPQARTSTDDGAAEAEPERAVVVGTVTAPESRRPVGGEPWEPVPVPLPTYVTKPEAPRREQATTVPTTRPRVALPPVWDVPVQQQPASTRSPAERDTAPDDSVRADEPRPRTETLGLPLEQILARRRAAG
ncbi:hypothetical protein ACNHYB_14405 [Isoptericola jiangsuensis]|uniref:hypothetical protein n=1 Tax=Isoptericola jiangsuensis TaxID=548579 RepID=UPI003AAF41DB